MGRTIAEALHKLVGGLMEKRQDVGSEKPELPLASIASGEDVVLNQSDYMKIKRIFDRVMGSQAELDRSLANYKMDLQSLGKVLEAAEAGKEETPPPE